MISQKLKTIFTIFIPVFILHGLEEYFTGLYKYDPFYQFFPNPKTAFMIFVLAIGNIFVVASYIFVKKNKWALGLSIMLGLLSLFEFIHFYDAIRTGGYYPGLISAFAFPIIAFYLWKELLKNFKQDDRN